MGQPNWIVPTPPVGDSSNRIANTEFVGRAISSANVATSGFALKATAVTAAGLLTGGGTLTASFTITATGATQANQTTATSTAVIVSPGVQQYHPSAAKAWAMWRDGGTTLLDSFNVSSVTRNFTGSWTVNLTTAFLSTSYVVLHTIVRSATFNAPYVGTAQTATSFVVLVQDGAGTGFDPKVSFVVCFGTQ